MQTLDLTGITTGLACFYLNLILLLCLFMGPSSSPVVHVPLARVLSSDFRGIQ